ncbi:hypothetical protein D9611_001214 [Ephemerocybe angulata]|uniref:Uncharacterized protein n=1 Tax=Ephemerocybe angulata TaxID=980116 RepID=A0A8H5FMG8_9AGAR|nr:hypothetical protein D9611_001214 [Tulosesus angulatus]
MVKPVLKRKMKPRRTLAMCMTNGDGRHFKNRHPWIKNAYLVPGGRYLVTLDRTWMLVWDIGLPGRTVEPAVLAKHKLDGNLNGWRFKLLDVDIVSDYTALRIVLREGFYGDIPPYIDPSQLPSDTRLVAFHRFEIRLPESGDHAIVMLGRLCVARTDNNEIKAVQCGHKVALEVSSGEILLWDTRRGGAFSLWKIPKCSAFYVQQGYLFAITSEGVQVIDFAQSSWQSPIKNGLVDPRSMSPVRASIYHTYEYPVEVGIIGRVILPKSIPTSGTVEYELRVDKRWANTYKIHRFSHEFDPEEPSSSTICFLGTPDSGTDRSCQPVLRFDGANGDSGYIFSQIESDVSMAIYKKAELLAGSQKFRDPTSIMTPENVSTLVQEVHVCPFSGRAVFLWDRRLVEDVMLEIADYL